MITIDISTEGLREQKQVEGETVSGNQVSWIMWPFVALWRLVTWFLAATGRLVAILIGFLLMAVGVVLKATVIGAIIGIPMGLLGLLLVIRGLF